MMIMRAKHSHSQHTCDRRHAQDLLVLDQHIQVIVTHSDCHYNI